MSPRSSSSYASPTTSQCSTIDFSSTSISNYHDTSPNYCRPASIFSFTRSFRCVPFFLLIPFCLIVPYILSLSSTFHSAISFPSIHSSLASRLPLNYPLSHTLSNDPSITTIAYYIQLTPETLPLLPRLYKQLWYHSNIYLLHFDPTISQASANQTLNLLKTIPPSNSSFQSHTFVLPRHAISYNGVSMVLSTLTAMRYLLTNVNIPAFDFFINLSGSDYPLVPAYLPSQLLSQVKQYDPVFLSLATPKLTRERFRQRLWKLQVDLAALTNLPNLIEIKGEHGRNPLLYKTFLKDSNNRQSKLPFEPVFSSSWIIASRRFCVYAISSSFADRLLVGMANMKGSDEFFFGTLAKHSNYWWKRVVPHVMRLVMWEWKGTKSGQHPFWLDHSTDDNKWAFEETLNKGPHWMGRKFRYKDSQIMDRIDRMVEDKSRMKEVFSNWKWIVDELHYRYQHGGDDEDYVER